MFFFLSIFSGVPRVNFESLEMGRKGSNVDYALYLVTDSTPAILGDRDIVDVVEASLRGGVTLVSPDTPTAIFTLIL